jgi:hypothetical protein
MSLGGLSRKSFGIGTARLEAVLALEPVRPDLVNDVCYPHADDEGRIDLEQSVSGADPTRCRISNDILTRHVSLDHETANTLTMGI